MYLLPQTSYGTPSVDPKTLTSDPVQAASYYSSNRVMQTVAWSLSETFVGKVKIQSTLLTAPDQDAYWMDVIDLGSITGSGYRNIVGKFTWIRVVITEWVSGDIEFISISY
jgi:hypothetical protein